MKAEGVVEALRRRHGTAGQEWAFFEEIRMGTGYGSRKKKYNPEQRMDGFAINLYPSNKFFRIAYEIKVSRSDFLSEIKNPQKRAQALDLSNEFYFVVPQGLVKRDEIPEECGLIYIYEDLTSRMIKRAPTRAVEDLPMEFVLSLARRASRAENEIRLKGKLTSSATKRKTSSRKTTSKSSKTTKGKRKTSQTTPWKKR